MKFDIVFERVYPHPREKVWRALTDRAALGQWLMETDFVSEAGRSFTMWCDDGKGGKDTYRCKLLEYEPPERMLWSWVLDGSQHLGETSVEFTLEETAEGCRVTVTHSGDRDQDTIDKFKGGWPYKLDQLETVLSGARPAA